MQLSCLPVSFFSDIVDGRMTVPEWAFLAEEIGLDGYDISILFVDDRSREGLRVLREECELTDLPLVMVTSYPDFTHPDPGQREREIEKACEIVAVSDALGAHYVRVTAGQAHPETERAQGVVWAIDGLTALCERTHDLDTTLVYENHAKPGAWQYTDFSQPPEIFLEIVAGTADVELGVNFDTGNAASFADDPLALLDAVLDRLVTVHAADTAAKGVQQAVLLGTGVTPFTEIFAVLKCAEWDGWICMEEYAQMGRSGVEMASTFIRGAWRGA